MVPRLLDIEGRDDYRIEWSGPIGADEESEYCLTPNRPPGAVPGGLQVDTAFDGWLARLGGAQHRAAELDHPDSHGEGLPGAGGVAPASTTGGDHGYCGERASQGFRSASGRVVAPTLHETRLDTDSDISTAPLLRRNGPVAQDAARAQQPLFP